MSRCIVTITDLEELSQAIDLCLRHVLESTVESYYMTYERSLLNSGMFEKTDLFILGFFREDDSGYRAEALPIAEKWLATGKRILIVSGATESGIIDRPFYWDLASIDLLADRVVSLLSLPPATPEDLSSIRNAFAQYVRPPFDRHNHSP